MERSRCQKVRRFFWWLRVPLTFGDALADEGDVAAPGQGYSHQRTADQVIFNGKIVSIQLLLLLIIISFTMIIWQVLTDSYGVIKTITLTFFMLIGLCILVYFNVYRSRVLHEQPGPDGDGDDDGRRRILSAVTSPPHRRDSLTVFGITTFYFLGCIMDIFQVLLTTSCGGVWSTCRTNYYKITSAVLVIFHVVRIAFLGAQTLFCIVFNRATFTDRATIRCGLMCVAAINMCLWFDFLVGIVFHLLRFERPLDSLKFPCYDAGDALNASADAVACLMQNTTMHQFLDKYMTPIFLPFSIEIAVLIGECLYHLFCHCATSPAVSSSIPRPTVKEYDGVGKHPEDDVDSDGKPEESKPTQEAEVNDCDESTRLLSSGSVSLAGNTTRLGWQVFFLLLFITNAFLLALAILYRVHTTTKIYLYYKFPFYLFMTFAIVIGYNASRDFLLPLGLPSFATIDYLLIVASFGQLSLNLLSFITFIDRTRLKVFFATQKILEMLQTYLQATFALYAGRVVPILTPGNSSNPGGIFRYVLFYLAVSNGTLWLVETFNGLNLNIGKHGFFADSAETRYYGRLPWALLFNTMAPLHLMFRLLSCLAFARAFMSLRRLHTS